MSSKIIVNIHVHSSGGDGEAESSVTFDPLQSQSPLNDLLDLPPGLEAGDDTTEVSLPAFLLESEASTAFSEEYMDLLPEMMDSDEAFEGSLDLPPLLESEAETVETPDIMMLPEELSEEQEVHIGEAFPLPPLPDETL